MQEKKEKEKDFSIKEIEAFTKKNRFQVGVGLAIVLASLFSYFLSMMGLSILGSAVGALIGILFPTQADKITKMVVQFVGRQEHTTQLVLGAVLLILGIFLPPVIFLLIGLHGGKDIRQMSSGKSE